MVYLKDILPFPGSQQLGTCLVVRTPIAGRYARSWPQLANSLYLKAWSQEISLNKTSKVWIFLAAHHQYSNELIRNQESNSSDQGGHRVSNEDFLPTRGHQIIQGRARWGDVLQFAGEFQYIKGYWEWTEDVLSRCKHKLDAAQIYNSVYASLFTYDRIPEVMKAFFEAWCPLTNTLLTSFGELSISLWDLHSIAGLPLTESLYDEVIPSFEELTSVDQTNNRFIPRSCKYLFHAYHLLRKSVVGGQFSRVSLEIWISFWSKKDMKYRQPLPRKEKKKIRPKSTHNPSGDFDVHQERTAMEETPFFKLGLDRKLRDETYLAAYLACWLCTFVLPINDVGSICPTTFKIASMMATSCYFKTHFSIPQDLRGPKMMQFFGEGGARYFDPKEARKRIHKGDSAHWTYNIITQNQNLLFVDDGKAKELEQDYFIAIRSNYLTLRQGEHFVIEPYKNYKKWWANIHENYFDENLESLISMKPTVRAENNDQDEGANPPMDKDHDVQIVKITESQETNKRKSVSHPIEESSTDRHWKRPKEIPKLPNKPKLMAMKLEKEIFGIDDDEESQDSQESSTKPNSYTPVAIKVSKEVVDSPKIKEPPQCIDVSIFEGKKLVLNNQTKFLQMLWADLYRKISNTPLDSISSIHDELQVVLTSMRSFDKFDISYLEERLKTLFDKVAAYDIAKSSSLNKTSKKILSRQMKKGKDRLYEARIKETKAKEELNDLEERKRNLIALLDQQQQILQSIQVEVHEIEEEIIAMKNTSSLSDEVTESLNTAMKQVEVAKKELENLKPFV
ncbi:hypothetical protein CDL12_16307 [Handroanthus impetiginosus]|uniref:Aminotransferase-like plant mobile domain-containing protein n=1 Tax=Handroanthus impetiginosus TaxID=429701 RepID=A0A2G9H0Q6_9LAMI|nr:hypothetical protein CDL12_16307 [Handroanthus impetiginosus]